MTTTKVTPVRDETGKKHQEPATATEPPSNAFLTPSSPPARGCEPRIHQIAARCQNSDQAHGAGFLRTAAIRSLEISSRLALQRPVPNHIVRPEKAKLVVCAKAGGGAE